MKNNITTYGIGYLPLALLALGGCSEQPATPTPPNVILVFIDDFGYGDLTCYGNTLHRTPHLSQMAEEGIRMTDFYVASSVSTPSRAALLTGCYPRRISMHVNADPAPSCLRDDRFYFLFPTKG